MIGSEELNIMISSSDSSTLLSGSADTLVQAISSSSENVKVSSLRWKSDAID